MQNDKFKGKKGKFLFLLFFPLLCALLIAIVMWLWNAVMPSLLHVSTITYWQAAGLFLLCRVLFGSFHFRPRGGGPPAWTQHNKWNEMKEMRDKWKNMSDEDRLQFKSKMRDRWCQPRREEKKEDESDSINSSI